MKKISTVLFFSYQRISDFIIAREIVNKFQDWESFAENINTDKTLHSIFVDKHWSFKGILEAMAILIPERFAHEMTDVIRFIPEDEYERVYYTCLNTISEAQINSLCWRAIESIDKETIIQFLGSKYCHINPDDWYNKLVELSTIPNTLLMLIIFMH